MLTEIIPDQSSPSFSSPADSDDVTVTPCAAAPAIVEDDLQLLHPKHAANAKYPPGCPVWYDLSNSSSKRLDARRGVVVSAYIHVDADAPRVYKITNQNGGDQFLWQDQLAYAHDCPVSVKGMVENEPDKDLEGVIVCARTAKGNRKLSYSVFFCWEGDGVRVELGVEADQISFRRAEKKEVSEVGGNDNNEELKKSDATNKSDAKEKSDATKNSDFNNKSNNLHKGSDRRARISQPQNSVASARETACAISKGIPNKKRDSLNSTPNDWHKGSDRAARSGQPCKTNRPEPSLQVQFGRVNRALSTGRCASTHSVKPSPAFVDAEISGRNQKGPAPRGRRAQHETKALPPYASMAGPRVSLGKRKPSLDSWSLSPCSRDRGAFEPSRKQLLHRGPEVESILTVPPWVYQKSGHTQAALFHHIIGGGGENTKYIAFETNCSVHIDQGCMKKQTPLVITIRNRLAPFSFRKAGDAIEMIMQFLTEFLNDKSSVGKLKREMAATAKGNYDFSRRVF